MQMCCVQSRFILEFWISVITMPFFVLFNSVTGLEKKCMLYNKFVYFMFFCHFAVTCFKKIIKIGRKNIGYSFMRKNCV